MFRAPADHTDNTDQDAALAVFARSITTGCPYDVMVEYVPGRASQKFEVKVYVEREHPAEHLLESLASLLLAMRGERVEVTEQARELLESVLR